MTLQTASAGPQPVSQFGLSKLSLFFATLLVVTTGYFLYWALGYTQGHYPILLVLATLFGVFMAFNIGGNDVANSFGTSVGAGTLTITQALLVAAVFEVSGAVIAGGEVTSTIRGGIVDLGGMKIQPLDFVYIMMSALIAAALWLLFATKMGYPVSTTHSIVGAIVGSSITLGILLSGTDAAFALVHWDKIGTIAVSWVLSPLLGGAVAYALFHQIKMHILNYNEQAEAALEKIKDEKREHNVRHKEAFERLSDIQKISYTHTLARDVTVARDDDYQPKEFESDYYRELNEIEKKRGEVHAYHALENWVPMIAAIGAMIISSMVLFKGLKHIDLGLTTLNNYLIMAMIGAAVWMATFIFAKTLKGRSLGSATFLMFSWMQVFTAAGFAFSHGSNDIANAIGPFAAILDVLRTGTMEFERRDSDHRDGHVWRRADRRAVVHRQGGDRDRRHEPDPYPSGLWLCRRALRRRSRHARFDVRLARLKHAYPDRRGARHWSGQPPDQLGSDEADRSRLGRHLAGSCNPQLNRIPDPAKYLLSALKQGWSASSDEFGHNRVNGIVHRR